MTNINSSARRTSDQLATQPTNSGLSPARLLRHIALTVPIFAARASGQAQQPMSEPANNSQFLPGAMAPAPTPEPSFAVSLGKPECPCLSLEQTPLLQSSFYSPGRQTFSVTQPNGRFEYPFSYGVDGCQAYDSGLAPYCDKGNEFPGNPDWCSQSFCYVDPNNCEDTASFPSTYFPGLDLHYSYKTCGNPNTFLTMINDSLERSFMELVAAVERGVISTKKEIEDKYSDIQEFAQNPTNVEQECQILNGCERSLEMETNQCWNRDLDFNDANLVLHPSKANTIAQEELDTLACLSNVIKPSIINIADAEHDDKNRIAYQYYGDQKTGGLVEYPLIEFCSESFDARFRPWYAQAASGPKDVIAVIDNSGSMAGDRINLARQATKAVVETLTWADRVSVITFSGDVNAIYSESLVAGTEENVDQIQNWIEKSFRSKGGTNFAKPLTKAYELLNNNKDANDQKTCFQAVLFLTDGQDRSFNANQFQPVIDANPNTVVFTYGLSADAEKSALQEIACRTGGIYHPVADTATLPKQMSSYYEYYSRLQDASQVAWIKYTDVSTDSPLLAGCAPVFDYDREDPLSPRLLGVNCMDLNTIVDLATLKSCNGNSFDRFIEQVFREATTCSITSPKISDECLLQNMRAQISQDSVCFNQAAPNDCSLSPGRNQSDFTQLSPSRFQTIPLSDCTIQNTCAAENTGETKEKGGKKGLDAGVLTGIILGSLAGLTIVGCALNYVHRKRQQNQLAVNRQANIQLNQSNANIRGAARLATAPPSPGGTAPPIQRYPAW